MTTHALTELALQAAAGDDAALEKLLVESQPLIAKRTRKFFPNIDDAQEAAQEILLTVSIKIGRFEGRSKYTTWLYQVATNSCINTYRQMCRRRSVQIEPPATAAAAGSTPSVVTGARIDLLDAAVEMKDTLITPVLMRDLLELPYEEIAATLNIPLGTAKTRIHDGRNELRRRLADHRNHN